MTNKGQLDDKQDGGSKVRSLLLSGGADGSTGGGWGGGDRNSNGSEVCWEKNGGIRPIGLEAMTVEETEVWDFYIHWPANNFLYHYSYHTY